MRISRKTIWTAALPLSLVVHCAAGTPEAEPTVTVVVLDYAGLPDRTLAGAGTVASSIFRKAGIALRWVDYSTWTQEVAHLKDGVPAVPSRVFVKILPESRASRFGLAGIAYGLAVGRQDAYIFADRVRTLAVSKGRSEPPILGCVVAHEIGHLLLGPGSHADGGIMSADLDVETFLQAERGHPPSFTSAQVRQILARLR